MTTLVFGGTGFFGRRTVPRLVDASERVVVMDINPATADYSALGDSVRVLGGDVTNFEDVVKAVMDAQPDRIINLAYMIGGGENTPHFSFRLDLFGMDNCFEAARLCGVNRVVYASSFAISGLQRHFGDRALTEDDPAYGSNIYAMNKRYNEFQAAQFNPAYGMNIVGIRPPMVTGYDKERGLHGPRAHGDAPRPGPARQLPPERDDADSPPRRRHRRDLHPHHPGRGAQAHRLQHRRHPHQPRRPCGPRAGVHPRRRHHLRERRRPSRTPPTTSSTTAASWASSSWPTRPTATVCSR